jgi:flavin reductase (DIM6/NTAB) family NADH-FMN oxidoreductase RutF
MEFDLQGADKSQAYRLLASVVVPRPIALVTSLGPGGEVNAAPFSFFNLLGSSPPVVALGIGDRVLGTAKDTRANIERTGEFVVNLVSESLVEAMNICGIDFPVGVSELDAAALTALPSVQVSAPRLAKSPVHLECRLHSIVSIGNNQIVLAEVVFLHINDEFLDLDNLRVHTEALDLIGRMHGGGWYARTTDLFDLPRLSYEEWLDKPR